MNPGYQEWEEHSTDQSWFHDNITYQKSVIAYVLPTIKAFITHF